MSVVFEVLVVDVCRCLVTVGVIVLEFQKQLRPVKRLWNLLYRGYRK